MDLQPKRTFLIILRDFDTWISILAVPTEAFGNLAGRWLVASIASAGVFGCSEYLFIPLEHQVINNIVAQSFGHAASAHKGSALGWEWQLLSVVWREAGMFVGWITLAGTVFVLSLAVQARISFQNSFSLVVHAEAVLALMALLSVLYAHTVSLDEVLRPSDLRLPISLNVLLSSSDSGSILGQVASKLSLFSLWFVAVLGLGVSVVGGFDRFRGVVIAAAAWAVWMMVSMIPSLVGFALSR